MPNTLLENLSSLVFPVECEICGASVNPDPPSGVCENCVPKIHKIAAPHCPGCGRSLTSDLNGCSICGDGTFPYDRAYACVYYEGVMRELLHAYKFHHRKYMKHFFLRLMKEFVRTHMATDSFDIVIPVPSGRDRKLERGFDPAALLSATIAKEFGLPHLSSALTRTRPAVAQALLAKPGRQKNLKGVFSVLNDEKVRQKNVLLIDDIMTTGETVSECARTLKKAGVAKVTVLALARGV